MEEGKTRSKHPGLILTLGVLILAIIGLVIGIVLVAKSNSGEEEEVEEIEPTVTELLQEEVNMYLAHLPEGTTTESPEYQELYTDLTNAMHDADTQEDQITNCINISRIQDPVEGMTTAADTLESCLDYYNLLEVSKYEILLQLLEMYKADNDIQKQITTLEKLVNLEDQYMDGELDNWQEIKETLRAQLNQLKGE